MIFLFKFVKKVPQKEVQAKDREMEKEGTSDTDNRSTITVNVKFSGRSIPVEISDESTVEHLKSLLQPHTNVLPRGQKLIFKGYFLSILPYQALFFTELEYKA